MSTALSPWSVRAVNLPEHADNPVHTVEGGLAAGYAGAVVAGTSVYAYLTRPAVEAWGAEWLGGGTAEVRFHAPVLADEAVDVVPVRHDEGAWTERAGTEGAGTEGAWTVEARSAAGRCATVAVGFATGDPPDPTGERLEPIVEALDDYWAEVPARLGEDLAIYSDLGIVHPVVWPSLANRSFSAQLVDGSWVHTRSAIRHLATAATGGTAVVEAWLIDRFTTRAGERAVADVRISVGDQLVAVLEHEAIVRLGG